MLQIASGKFFTSDDRFVHKGYGIGFSNFAWVGPIETCVATLNPIEPYQLDCSPYVITYTNQIEKEKSGQARLVRIGDAEIVEQFLLLATFGLRSFFHVDRDVVELCCADRPRTAGDPFVGASFAPPFLATERRGQQEEVIQFAELVEKMIGMPRRHYVSVINSLRAFSGALQVLRSNVDLAYSMLVYSLESLTQEFDAHEPTWDEYDEGARKRVDDSLRGVERQQAQGIRAAILSDKHVRLTKRFVEFVEAHVQRSFFTERAIEVERPITRSQLPCAVRNAYLMRSKYVHQLEPIRDQLRYPISKGDVIQWSGRPFLTFRGLVRLVHEVIVTFVQAAPAIETEAYEWRRDLPGKITVEFAPEYWIGRSDTANQGNAVSRLTGFVENIEAARLHQRPIVDMRDVLKKYCQLIHSMNPQNRRATLAMCRLYSEAVKADDQCHGYRKILENHAPEFEKLSIEMLVTGLLIGRISWDAEECAACLREYQARRFGSGSFRIPRITEMSLMLSIANSYLTSGQKDGFDVWAEKVILEAAGWPETQALVEKAIAERSEVDLSTFLETAKREQPGSTKARKA